VLITGAGSGLGRALAERHAVRGDAVACADLDRARAEATCAALSGSGHLAFAVDVGSDESMQALADEVRAVWGRIDVLYNNAGIASGGPMVETTMDEWRRILEVDLLGVVRGCRLFLPEMLAAGRGAIVNTASFAGLAGAPGSCPTAWPRPAWWRCRSSCARRCMRAACRSAWFAPASSAPTSWTARWAATRYVRWRCA
jgi:NAD(P)-dependent dehydrogenase (short-subunit alcohol dehydrogenase family)